MVSKPNHKPSDSKNVVTDVSKRDVAGIARDHVRFAADREDEHRPDERQERD